MSAPTCYRCSKPLRRYMEDVAVPWDRDPADVTNEEIRTPAKRVRELKEFAANFHRASIQRNAELGYEAQNPDQTYHVSVFRGNYGYNGRNHFCNGKCAKDWADDYLDEYDRLCAENEETA